MRDWQKTQKKIKTTAKKKKHRRGKITRAIEKNKTDQKKVLIKKGKYIWGTDKRNKKKRNTTHKKI